MKQKIILLALLLLLPTATFAYDFQVNGLYYDINNDGETVTLTYNQRYPNSIYQHWTSIIIPENVTYDGTTYTVTRISAQCFYCCESLTRVSIPNSIKTIGMEAFFDCSGLTSVTIPSSVTDIQRYAFEECTSLSSIDVESGNPIYDSRDDCNAIIITASNALYFGCKNTIIPYSVTKICDYAFAYIPDLTSITLYAHVTFEGSPFRGNNVKNLSIVGEGHFYPGRYFFSGIDTLNIGSGVTSLGAISLSPNKVNCYAETPPTCTASTFTNYNGELHVPPTSTVAYIMADYWQNFGNINNDINEKITLNESNVELVQWDELQLLAMVSAESNVVKWFSTDPNVATVDTNGKVKAVSGGECSIYCTLANNVVIYTTCHIVVSYPEITLALNKEELEFSKPGEVETLIAIVSPENTGLKPIWASTDETVAIVDVNGVVTAKGEGECDITVSLLDKTATCHVTVNSTIIISLDQHEAMLLPNHIIYLIPSGSPVMPDGFTVTSSDPSVAAARVVNNKIQVVGIKEGTTTITVGSVDGTAIPATCLITVYTEPGDMNCDGFVNISDVTSLIDYLLSGDDSQISTKNADVNGDESINISDVTTLIDILLQGT